MNTINLPVSTDTTDVKQFFDKFFVNQISFPSNQIDAVVGFFLKHGFDVESSRSVGIVLLNQARADNVNVFELIEQHKEMPTIIKKKTTKKVVKAKLEEDKPKVNLEANPEVIAEIKTETEVDEFDIKKYKIQNNTNINVPNNKQNVNLPNNQYVNTSNNNNQNMNKYVRVEDYRKAQIVNHNPDWFSCLITSHHRIKIGNELFWDWEDHYVKA